MSITLLDSIKLISLKAIVPPGAALSTGYALRNRNRRTAVKAPAPAVSKP